MPVTLRNVQLNFVTIRQRQTMSCCISLYNIMFTNGSTVHNYFKQLLLASGVYSIEISPHYFTENKTTIISSLSLTHTRNSAGMHVKVNCGRVEQLPLI